MERPASCGWSVAERSTQERIQGNARRPRTHRCTTSPTTSLPTMYFDRFVYRSRPRRALRVGTCGAATAGFAADPARDAEQHATGRYATTDMACRAGARRTRAFHGDGRPPRASAPVGDQAAGQRATPSRATCMANSTCEPVHDGGAGRAERTISRASRSDRRNSVVGPGGGGREWGDRTDAPSSTSDSASEPGGGHRLRRPVRPAEVFYVCAHQDVHLKAVERFAHDDVLDKDKELRCSIRRIDEEPSGR